MVRYKGTQANHLYEKSIHTLCTLCEKLLQAKASTILELSLSHPYAYSAIMVSMYLYSRSRLMQYLTSDAKFNTLLLGVLGFLYMPGESSPDIHGTNVACIDK